MIRNYETKDLSTIMKLWLDSNVQAHSFIAKTYWESSVDAVATMLPNAQIYVYEAKHEVIAFVGIMGNDIAGIFVDSNQRSKGIGKALLNELKRSHSSLSLQVYDKNKAALNFYLREGFELVSTGIDEATNEVELTLKWLKQ